MKVENYGLQPSYLKLHQELDIATFKHGLITINGTDVIKPVYRVHRHAENMLIFYVKIGAEQGLITRAALIDGDGNTAFGATEYYTMEANYEKGNQGYAIGFPIVYNIKGQREM